MNVQWSEADQFFLVTIPEFADRVVMPCTHGETREQAIHNGEEVIEMYLEAWQMEFLNRKYFNLLSDRL